MMIKKVSITTSLVILVSLLISPAMHLVVAHDPITIGFHEYFTQQPTLTDSKTGLYVVELDDPSLTNYLGGIPGLAATNPQVTGNRKLDSSTKASKGYLNYLESKQRSLITQMEKGLGRQVEIVFQYQGALNALAVAVSHDEAQHLAGMPGVRMVYPDLVKTIDTDVGPLHIGAKTIWDEETITGLNSRGEGIIIGVLDTGINHQHVSFAATDEEDYTHTNPYGSGVYKGWCETQPAFCNDKLIAAHTFHPNGGSPEDTHGHGSHTAGTAAGNRHTAQLNVGADVFAATIQGVAPRANIVAYKVCDPTCPSSAIIAGINSAILNDQVDVLNYSLTGGDNPWVDPVDLAFLNATAAGIFISASAGNNGPSPGSIGSTAPWTATVGASTHSRLIAHTLHVTAPTTPPDLQGLAAVAGEGTHIASDLNGWIRYDQTNPLACTSYSPSFFVDAFALVQQGGCSYATKVAHALNAGAIGVVVFNNVGGAPSKMDGLTGFPPAVMIDLPSGIALREYVLTHPATAKIRLNTAQSFIVNHDWADRMAGFSSRGPSQFELVKPDFVAPGVDILAAANASTGTVNQYALYQGTSMSSPHVAGAAALMIALHPTWSPAAVKSALSTSANPSTLLNDTTATLATPYDQGSGLLDLKLASRTGLVLDEAQANYLAANPAIGGDVKTLNQPSLVNVACQSECSWSRTVTNTLNIATTYTAVVTAPNGMTITVTPSSFTIGPGESQALSIKANLGDLPDGLPIYASVWLETDDFYSSNDSSAPIVTLLDERFTNQTFPPENWSLYDLDGGSSQWSRTTSYFNTAPASAYHYFSSTGYQEGWLVSPRLTLDETRTTLTFAEMTQYPSFYDYQGVSISTSSCDPADGQFIEWFEVNDSGISWRSIEKDLSAYAGETLCIGFEYRGNNASSWYIDDVLVTKTPHIEVAVSNLHLPVVVLPKIINPILTLHPEKITASQPTDTIETHILTIGNDGGLPLEWQVVEATPLSLSQPSAKPAAAMMPPSAPHIFGSDISLMLNHQESAQFYLSISNLADDVHPGDPLGALSNNPYLKKPLPVGNMAFPGKPIAMNLHADSVLSSCDFPDDIHWLSVIPQKGTIPPDSSQQVDIRFNSTGLDPGAYTANLCLASNDPVRPLAVVGLTLHVTVPCLRVAPTSLEQTLLSDSTGSQILTIHNVCDMGIGFAIREADRSGDSSVLLPESTFSNTGLSTATAWLKDNTPTANKDQRSTYKPSCKLNPFNGVGSIQAALQAIGIDDKPNNLKTLIGTAVVDIPWLTVNPLNGIVPAESALDLMVSYDSTGLLPGDYFASILVLSAPDDIINVPVTLQVEAQTEPPRFISEDNTTFKVDQWGTFAVLATGNPIPDITFKGNLPVGVTWLDHDDGTATLLGTPVAGSGGVYPLTLSARNAIAPDAEQMFTLTVVEAPGFTSANSTTFSVGNPGSFTIETRGYPIPAITHTGLLPDGVTLIDNLNRTATLSGTPIQGTGGAYMLTIKASNTIEPDSSQVFTLTVADDSIQNNPPEIISADHTNFTVGKAGSFVIEATGIPTPDIQYSGNLPSGLVWVDNQNGTAMVSGVPSKGSGGIHTLTINASNNITPDAQQQFTLKVLEAPEFTSTNTATFNVGEPGSFTISTKGYPEPLIEYSGDLPKGITLNNQKGTAILSGIPDEGSGGIYILTMTASNTIEPDSAQVFTLTIVEDTVQNESPKIISEDNTSFTVGKPGSFIIESSGVPKPQIKHTGNLPEGLTLVDHKNGTATLSGAPATGSGGTHTLSLIANNSVLPDDEQVFRLTIFEAPAIINSDKTTFTVGEESTFTITTRGFPIPEIMVAGYLPIGVHFVDNNDHTATLSGQPEPRAGGIYELTITTSNQVEPDAQQAFTLTVLEAPTIISQDHTTYTEGTTGSFTIESIGFPTPEITFTGNLPDGVNFINNPDGTVTLSGTPTEGSAGVYFLTLTASNGIGQMATQAFTLTVVGDLPKGQAPIITSDDTSVFIIGESCDFTIIATGDPVPLISYTGNLPAEITLVDNKNGTAILSGKPGIASAGNYILIITAHNDVMPDDTQLFTLRIIQLDSGIFQYYYPLFFR